jgi:tetratricopeptide (TPR) repeat protein
VTVEDVAEMLRERVGRVMRERRWQAGTTSAQALALLKQAVQDKENADSLVERTQPLAAIPEMYRADSALARAAQADPKWADPLIERAWVARSLGFTMLGLVGPDSAAAAFGRGVQYANAALKLGKDTARAYEIRGVLRHAQRLLSAPSDDSAREQLLAAAEKDLDSAIRSDPALPRALDVVSLLQVLRGEFERARLTTERAYRADYYVEAQPVLFRLFETAFETGQDSLARRRCALIARRLPREWYGAECRLMLMTWSDDPPNVDSARQIVARAIATTPPAIRRGIEAQLTMLAVGVVARTVPRDSAAHVLEGTRAREILCFVRTSGGRS